MTGRYKTYQEYADSQVDWIGRIPNHWGVKRLKFIFDIKKRIAGQLGFDVLSITQKGIIVKDIESGDGQLSMDYSKYQLVFNGDFAMNHMDLLTGYVDISDFNGVTSPDYRVFTIKDKTQFFDRYYLYLLQMCYKQKIFFPLGQGSAHLGRWRLPTEAFNEVEYPHPDYLEQQKIANFLDHETAKIDTLIIKQERLIELLKEKRQAVISHAVTKGLNPDAPMKDSGVEWLGEVPEHWNILKFGITNKSAELGGNYNSGEGEEGLPLIKMGNLGRGDISLKKMEYLPIEESFDKAHLLKCGDFLFNTRNSLDLVGKVSIWKNELPRALYNLNVLRISFEPTLVSSSQYMSYLFNSDLGLSQLRLIAKGTTSVAAIYYKELKSISFPLPTLKEQEEIVEYVEKNIEKLDALIKQSQKAIQLIKERKTALISAAVTGKIDVRDWDAQGVQG
ncbi:TPA: restriction endonuclease subunit S [Vibrio parahaemolyticus]|nr:restriction endonuclease subunit S [Vibrio parahaemolyticus]